MRVFTLPKLAAKPSLAAVFKGSHARALAAVTPPIPPGCEITDPAALLGDKEHTPEEMLAIIKTGAKSIDFFHRKELIGLALYLGALHDDCKGKTVKAMRDFVTQQIETMGEGVAAATNVIHGEPHPHKPRVASLVRLPRRLA